MDKSKIVGDYLYGFNDGEKDLSGFPKGHSEEVIWRLSASKNEPTWMLDIRLKAYQIFLTSELPNWGPSLKELNFDELTYYVKATKHIVSSWDEVPSQIRKTFNQLGISEKEQEWLAGLATQYDSEMIYASSKEELKKMGVIFCSTDEAVQQYPELVQKYFGTLIKPEQHLFAALNTAFWSGGTFVFVPKGVKLTRPLQSYFRINARSAGQFERTMIIAEDESLLHYVEGCTAPTYSTDNLHAAVVEVFVGQKAHCKYSTIQNWSSNVYNLVSKSAVVEREGIMEWVDGNLGSKVNMKYPSTILKGDYSSASCLSVAFASKNVVQDVGAKMIHLGKWTSSNIFSKSLSQHGGIVNYRGMVKIMPEAEYASAKVECDTMILDKLSKSDTIPTNMVGNSTSSIEHEATVSSISDEEIYYLKTKSLSEEEAREMIVLGFVEPFAKEIPLEYASELNKLIKIELESEIG